MSALRRRRGCPQAGTAAAVLLSLMLPLVLCPCPVKRMASSHDCCAGDATRVSASDCCGARLQPPQGAARVSAAPVVLGTDAPPPRATAGRLVVAEPPLVCSALPSLGSPPLVLRI